MAKRSYNAAEKLLEMAEAFDWPAGVTSSVLGEPIVIVAGGMGGEAAWREWIASFGGAGGDELMVVWSVLNHVAELVTTGIDPGPPATWDGQAIAALDAEEAEEESLGLDIFGRPRPR